MFVVICISAEEDKELVSPCLPPRFRGEWEHAEVTYKIAGQKAGRWHCCSGSRGSVVICFPRAFSRYLQKADTSTDKAGPSRRVPAAKSCGKTVKTFVESWGILWLPPSVSAQSLLVCPRSPITQQTSSEELAAMGPEKIATFGPWSRSPALATSVQREMKAASRQQLWIHSPHHPVSDPHPGLSYSGSFEFLLGEILALVPRLSAIHRIHLAYPLVVVV